MTVQEPTTDYRLRESTLADAINTLSFILNILYRFLTFHLRPLGSLFFMRCPVSASLKEF